MQEIEDYGTLKINGEEKRVTSLKKLPNEKNILDRDNSIEDIYNDYFSGDVSKFKKWECKVDFLDGDYIIGTLCAPRGHLVFEDDCICKKGNILYRGNFKDSYLNGYLKYYRNIDPYLEKKLANILPEYNIYAEEYNQNGSYQIYETQNNDINNVMLVQFLDEFTHPNISVKYYDNQKNLIKTYIGSIHNKQPNGYGNMIYADGSSFEGDFKDGKPCYGIKKDKNGKEYEAKYDDNGVEHLKLNDEDIKINFGNEEDSDLNKYEKRTYEDEQPAYAPDENPLDMAMYEDDKHNQNNFLYNQDDLEIINEILDEDAKKAREDNIQNNIEDHIDNGVHIENENNNSVFNLFNDNDAPAAINQNAQNNNFINNPDDSGYSIFSNHGINHNIGQPMFDLETPNGKGEIKK